MWSQWRLWPQSSVATLAAVAVSLCLLCGLELPPSKRKGGNTEIEIKVEIEIGIELKVGIEIETELEIGIEIDIDI